MIKVTAVTERFKSEIFFKDEKEAQRLWVKARSQMNNNHTVTFGHTLINPKHLHTISFEIIEDKETEL